MAQIVIGDTTLKHDSLGVIPLGGQSEIGQTLWVLTYGEEMLLIDAGAAFPAEDLPGVDLLFPTQTFCKPIKKKSWPWC